MREQNPPLRKDPCHVPSRYASDRLLQRLFLDLYEHWSAESLRFYFENHLKCKFYSASSRQVHTPSSAAGLRSVNHNAHEQKAARSAGRWPKGQQEAEPPSSPEDNFRSTSTQRQVDP